jgi:MarR family transcriptional regulator, transcriptional regulator for hemolysin
LAPVAAAPTIDLPLDEQTSARLECCMSNKKPMRASASSPVRIDDALAYRIYRCARLLRGYFRSMAASLGVELSQEQWFVLNRLSHQDGLAQGQLGDALLDDRPNMARLIASMESRGLLRRASDPADARKYSVFITAEGRRVHDLFNALVPGARTSVLQGIAAADAAAVTRGLARIESNLERG